MPTNRGSEKRSPADTVLAARKVATRHARRRWLAIGAVFAICITCTGTWWVWRWQGPLRAEASYKSAVATGNWQAALDSSERWVRYAPDSAEAWLGVAEATRRLGQFERTADALGRLPVNDRRSLKVLALRGDLLLSELRRPAAAEDNWRRMLQLAPSADLPHQRLIYLYAMTLQRPKLLAQIRSAIQQGAEPREAYVYLMTLPSLQFSDGLIKTTDWLRGEPDNRDLLVAQAVYAARSTPSKSLAMFGEHAAAPGNQALLQGARNRFPDDPELLAVPIDIAIFDGDADAVEVLLSDVATTAELDSRFWRYRGWLSLTRMNHRDAVAKCEQALLLHPLDWKSRHLLADAQRLSGDSVAAAKNSDLAIRGKQLERTCLELANASAADSELLHLIWHYARDCGDEIAAAGLKGRLEPRASPPPR